MLLRMRGHTSTLPPPFSVLILVVAAFVASPACQECRGQTNAQDAARYAEWGAETLATIRRDLWLAERGLYAEKATARSAPGDDLQPAFMWGAGVQLSALAAAAQVDPGTYAKQLSEYADGLQEYWIEHDGIGGYSVLPGQRRADRYYDDNAWIVLGLIETATVASDVKFLERARATQRFVMSGEDETLAGGVYWRENRRRSKNTCANAPAIVGALLLHRATNEPQYLADAERLYAWTQSRLQDPEDGLYWDNVRRSERVDRRKYSYNSAVMIRANCLLYEITKGRKYLEEAERIAHAAVEHWIVLETGALKDGGRFGHMLLESLLAVRKLDGNAKWLDTANKCAEFVHAKVRDPNGRYAQRWDRQQSEPLESFQLLDQASAARTYFVSAAAMSGEEEAD